MDCDYWEFSVVYEINAIVFGKSRVLEVCSKYGEIFDDRFVVFQ